MLNSRQHSTQGIILKKYARNEFDYSITFYSPHLGKVQALAKGARKITSSLTGHLETLNLCNLQLYQSPKGFTIIQCQTEKNFKNIRGNLERSLTATLLIEIFEKSIFSEDSHPELFDLLTGILQELETEPESFLAIEEFKLRFLQALGVLPDITICFSCNKRWNGAEEIWLANDGHLSCGECRNQLQSSAQKVNFHLIKLINFLLQNNRSSQKIFVSKIQRAELKNLNRLFLSNYINQEIFSEKIISKLQNAG